MVDRLLPRERRWRYEVGADGDAPLRTPSPPRSRAVGGTPPRDGRRSTRRAGARHPRAAVPLRRAQLRRDRHRLRGVPRRQPRARRRSARAPRLRAAQRVPARAAGGGRRRDARRAGEPRLRALPPGSVLALSVHLGGGGAARRQAGRQLDHLGRGARFPAGRLRAPDVVRDLPRPAHRGSPRRSGSAGDDGGQRGLRPLPPAVRAGAGARGPRAPRSDRGRRKLHRLPHAEEEHGPRLRADALPPHRAARRSGARRARPADRVRALPHRQDGRGSGRQDGGAGGGESTIARRSRTCTAPSTRARCRRR